MTKNDGPSPRGLEAQAAPSIDESLRAGLALLWQAYRYAMDAGAELWDFALESERLYRTDLTISDLRWLVAKGFAEHGRETSFYGDAHRSFRPSPGLNFVPRSCFVLTPRGAEFAGRILGTPSTADHGTDPPSRPALPARPAAIEAVPSSSLPPREEPRDRSVIKMSREGP